MWALASFITAGTFISVPDFETLSKYLFYSCISVGEHGQVWSPRNSPKLPVVSLKDLRGPDKLMHHIYVLLRPREPSVRQLLRKELFVFYLFLPA